MLSGLCFLGVNSILTVILTLTLKGKGCIDNLFLAALILTAMGNIFLAFDVLTNIININVFLSSFNVGYALLVNSINKEIINK